MKGGERGNTTSTLQKPDHRDEVATVAGGQHRHLLDGIATVLSRWNGLQMAVNNHWGGPDSLQKSHKLASDIFSCFSQSKAPLYVEDVENLLHESLLLSFNTDIEDGSIEEVAEQLMILHEEFLQ
ncbi:Pre-rRNA-processing protein TSR [Trema orientale]|uniref:Pre-rRNA-processing protein TSR n=1 Tax=Trema orientale TaxID=63057 RepID=A0A2P5FWI0_TREOI|nr:Pre-rRNA-processing protein TSR [Trema orientale]